MASDAEWTLELVDDDLEVPGWLFVPGNLDADEQQQWVAATTTSLVGSTDLEGRFLEESGVSASLRAILQERAESDSDAIFQVWPSLHGETAACHVNILPSAELPDWTEPSNDAVVHAAEATHLGPGLQVTTSFAVELEDDTVAELMGMHLIFDNGDVTLMLSLAETAPPLIDLALPGFLLLAENLRMHRADDGEPFTAMAPKGLLDDGPWDIEEPA